MIGARQTIDVTTAFSGSRTRGVRTAAVCTVLVVVAFAVLISPASARGHGGPRFSGGSVASSGRFATGHRHGNDAYVKAASQERDRLLKTLKDICRGC